MSCAEVESIANAGTQQSLLAFMIIQPYTAPLFKPKTVWNAMDFENQCDCEVRPCDCAKRYELISDYLRDLGITNIEDAPDELIDKAHDYADKIIAAVKQ